MHILSKSTYIKGEQCVKALYLFKNRPYLRDKLSIEQRAKFKRGTDVGVLARSCFPGGVNMSPSSPSQFDKKTAETLQNLSNPEINVMYEAVFQYDDTLIMLDILVRDGEKWRAIEVKSSMALNETYFKDAALQYYVLKGNNVPISDLQLMYIDGSYVRNGDIDLSKLFALQSVKDFAEEYLDTIEKNIKQFKEVVAMEHAPKIDIGLQCNKPYPCEFHGLCWKNIPDDSFLFTMAWDNEDLFKAYYEGTKNNRQFKKLVSNNSLEMCQLDALIQRTYYLDYKIFYTLTEKKPKSVAFLNILFYKPAIPLIDNDHPYQEFMLAFSILSRGEDGIRNVNWNCIGKYYGREEGISILTKELQQYERIVCFSPQNISTSLSRHNILETKDINCKIFNFKEILQQANFYHPNIKYDFSLKNLYEGIFSEKHLFEHSRILLNAMNNNELNTDLVIADMETENLCLRELYSYFMR